MQNKQTKKMQDLTRRFDMFEAYEDLKARRQENARMADSTIYDASVQEYQDQQERQIAGCRGFYSDEKPIPVVEAEDLFHSVDRTEIVVSLSMTPEVCAFLRDPKTWLAFKPAVIEDHRGVVLVF